MLPQSSSYQKCKDAFGKLFKRSSSQTSVVQFIPEIAGGRNKPLVNDDIPYLSTSGGASNYFKDYCDNTSIHGWKYVMANDTSRLERVTWLLCCCIILVLTTLYLWPIMIRYTGYDISTTIVATNDLIYNVDFPAVTLCSTNRASKQQLAKATTVEPWKKYHVETLQLALDVMSSLSDPTDSFDKEDEEEVADLFNNERKNLAKFMQEVSPSISRVAVRCWWAGVEVKCKEIFEDRNTDHGFCWSFNTLSYTTLQKRGSLFGFMDRGTDTKKEKIRRVNGAGVHMGLSVLLNPDVEDYSEVRSNEFHGFKVLVHHPANFAFVNHRGFIISAGQEVHTSVIPRTISSTETVKNIPKDHRNCYFKDEGNLKLYSSYSYSNCILECIRRSMKKTCQCVPYVYEFAGAPEDACNFTGIKCIKESIRKYSAVSIPGKMSVDRGKPVESMTDCNCPVSCTDSIYNVKTTNAEFPIDTANLIVPDHLVNINKSELILLRVFFQDMSYIKYQRSVTYDWEDVIAGFGGISGLFIGFSFISGLEIAYFFIIRPAIRKCHGCDCKCKSFCTRQDETHPHPYLP